MDSVDDAVEPGLDSAAAVGRSDELLDTTVGSYKNPTTPEPMNFTVAETESSRDEHYHTPPARAFHSP